jgi:hypothetical protein
MTSSYLNAPLRTEAEAKAAEEARLRRKYVARLRRLAGRLDTQALTSRNGGDESQAGRLSSEAFAIRWALRQIDPQIEGPKQLLDQIAGAAE